MKDFFEQVAQQTEDLHRMIVDAAESIIIDGNEIKKVWLGDVDGWYTYWDPDTYEEVEYTQD